MDITRDYHTKWNKSKERQIPYDTVKHPSAMQETQVRSLGWEDPLEKEMAAHSSILAWKIPWTVEPGRLLSTGSQRVGHDWVTSLHFTWPLICGIKIWHKWTYPWNRITQRTDCWLLRQRGVGGKREWEAGVSRSKSVYILWINNKVLLYSTGNYTLCHMITIFNILSCVCVCIYIYTHTYM